MGHRFCLRPDGVSITEGSWKILISSFMVLNLPYLLFSFKLLSYDASCKNL